MRRGPGATRRLRGTRARVFLSLLLLGGPALPGAGGGLEARQAGADPPDPDAGPLPEAAAPEVVTPRGAFIRSLAVPGWGHVASGSYARAGFYVSALSGSLWMLQQAVVRRDEAASFVQVERELAQVERELAASRLMAAGVDPGELDDALEKDDLVQARDALVEAQDALVEARDGQVEDWTALSIFLVLLGATDALVAAHLADYPEPLVLRAVPRGAGEVELRVSIPLEWLPFGL